MGSKEKCIEKELKYQLDKEDYESFKGYLIEKCSRKEIVDQTNYYIDTDDLKMREKNITMRIRKKPQNRYEFTIKTLREEASENVSIKNEYNMELDSKSAMDILGEGSIVRHSDVTSFVGDIIHLSNDEIEKLRVIGELRTERTFYEVKEGMDYINTDVSDYLGERDYEIEWETDGIEEAQKLLWMIFDEIKITPAGKNTSKKKRFMRRYEYMKKEQ